MSDISDLYIANPKMQSVPQIRYYASGTSLSQITGDLEEGMFFKAIAEKSLHKNLLRPKSYKYGYNFREIHCF